MENLRNYVVLRCNNCPGQGVTHHKLIPQDDLSQLLVADPDKWSLLTTIVGTNYENAVKLSDSFVRRTPTCQTLT